MEKTLLISLGAVLGANARYWVGDWAVRRWGAAFPYGTLLINLVGSFVLGLFVAHISQRLMIGSRWQLVIAIGFMGSFTTFSTYTYDSINLILGGQWGAGFFNLLGSAMLGLLAALLGIAVGRLLLV